MSAPTAPEHGLHGGNTRPQPYPTDKPEERRCDICNARVTQTKTKGEVGHKYDCPDRPDGLPRGGSGGSYHKGGEE